MSGRFPMPTLQIINNFVTSPGEFSKFKHQAGTYLKEHDVEPEAAGVFTSVPSGGTLDEQAVTTLARILAQELQQAVADKKLIW
jgi:hypothetical protein